MRRVLFLTFFFISTPIALAQDPVKVDSKHYSVMLDNDQVRVLKIHYNPKEKSVMHEHPASVVVFLNNSKVKFTLPDGSTVDSNGKAGDVQFTEAGKHLPQNVGTVAVNAVLVELKGGASSAKVASDPVKVDPAHHKVVFENDRVRVLRIKLDRVPVVFASLRPPATFSRTLRSKATRSLKRFAKIFVLMGHLTEVRC